MEVKIKGRNNETFIERVFLLRDLEYKENFKSLYCEEELSRRQLHRIIHLIKSLVNYKHILIGGFFFAIINIFSFTFSVMIRLLSYICLKKL